jgi:ferritin-like metal-binding protein YciE
MPATNLEEQITKYLTDAHSIEEQALAQMEARTRHGGDPDLARIYAEHRAETREHEQAVRDELSRRGAEPSTVKDIAGKVGGWGMVLFARLNPDTPGKLAVHAYSYEHMELAAYELLRRMAERAGEEPVRDLAQRIGAQERAMADGSPSTGTAPWTRRSRRRTRRPRRGGVKYLRDAHALEAQAIAPPRSRPRVPRARERVPRRTSQRRASTSGSSTSACRSSAAVPARFQAGALRVGALNLGTFFKLQPDTPLKLAGFAFAFEALEAGAYEMLARTAERAGDTETAALARLINGQERAAAERVSGTWDAAVDAVARERAVCHEARRSRRTRARLHRRAFRGRHRARTSGSPRPTAP